MNPRLNALLTGLQAADGDPSQTALAVADFACAKNPDLARVLMAAAIPHWFTADTLAALLDDDLKPRAAEWHAAVVALPMVEDYPERRAHAVHDQTRLALRDRFWKQEPQRFKELSLRAAQAYGSADSEAADYPLTCEHVFHQLASQTEAGMEVLWRVFDGWNAAGRWEPLQSLARSLDELCSAQPPPLLPRAEGWALLDIAYAREGHLTSEQQLHYAERAHALFAPRAQAAPEDLGAQRDLAVSLTQLGDLAVAQGDLAGALRRFTKSKTICERLAASDPANFQWQRDLFISWSKISDVAMEQGDLASARKAYEEVLAVNERLAASDPANAAWQRDLSVSLNRLGGLAVKQGDLAGALLSFTGSKTIRERLAKSAPANVQWQRDLSVSLEKLGDLAVAQGDRAGALRSYTESKTIRERLAASDPANAEWQRDLSLSCWLIASKVHEPQERWADALALMEQSLGITQRLAAADPTNVTWQQDLRIDRKAVARLREKVKEG